MKVYLNKEYKCVKVEDNTFVANDSSNFIRYYFVTNANGDVIDKMDDTSVIYRNTEPSYVTVAFRRADGNVIQHLMASPKTDTTGNSFFEYEITDTDGVLYKKGALEISAQFIEATLSETGGVKKVISQKVKAIAINTAHVLDNIGEEAEEYYSQYEQANNDAHAVLQAQITTNFNNIGTLQDLTTDAKDDLVKAINEVDAHADANKAEIGNLSNLTTDEKTTIVGAINEVDAHADANKAEIGTLNALTTDEKATLVGAINEVDNHADNATTLANNAVATANGAVATANEAKTTAQTAENNANSAVDKANDAVGKANEAIMKADAKATSIGFMTAKDAVTALNGYPRNQLKGGDTIWIVEEGTPDLWVTEVAQESVPYNYTTKDKFNQDLVDNKVLQIGYFKTAYQESDGKPVTIAWQNVLVKSTDWVASTEFADFPYEAKIELTDFVDYTTVPQVVFDIADTMSGNYAPICKSGDKCVYIYGKVQDEITLKTVITFAPNVNGASVVGGGYNNRGKWVASTTYAIDDLVYTDNGQFVCIEGITSTTSPEQDTTHWQATFVATGKTKNTLTISGQDNGTGVQKNFDGSQAVEIAFDENTMTAKEVDGVLKVGAKGTIPEALPQTAGALKSGNLPTSGWTKTGFKTFWEGTAKCDASTYKPIGTSKALADILYSDDTAYMMVDYNYQYYGSHNEQNVAFSYKNSNASVNGMTGISFRAGSNVDRPTIFIARDGTMYGRGQNTLTSAYAVTYTRIGTSTISQQFYTISDTDITANSDILMELTDEGGVKAHALASGSITVIRDTVPTQAIPYTYKVKQTNASGQFTLVNHYVPSIPESPTSLPVTYKKASGSLPTSGWGDLAAPLLVSGEKTIGSDFVDIGNIGENNAALQSGWKVTTTGTINNTYIQGAPQSSPNIDIISNTGYFSLALFSNYNQDFGIRIYTDGSVRVFAKQAGNYNITIYNTNNVSKTYTISDTFITANTSVKMYLTDEGGVKAQSKASGSITVIRDEMPTTAIPYEYEVEQTSASGLFEVINAYIPDVPIKTSQLQNDSGFITSSDIPTIPTKTSQLENDSNFAKTNTPNSWGSTQTFTAYDGIKTNRICNAAGTSLVDGTGTTNKFGNGNMPTIIKTSEARPKAEVPYADGTATRQIALLEDIPSMVIDWVGPSATEQVITGTGMRQIFAEFTDTVGDVSTLYKFYGEVYVDGQNEVNGTSSTVYSTNTEGTELHVITVTPTIRRNTDNQFVLRAECCRYTIGASPMSINKSYLSFVFRKRLY